jgi:uncharacterized protein with FMN-binding domain
MHTDPGQDLAPPAPIDPVLQARLDRLAANRASAGMGAAATATPWMSPTPSSNVRTRKRHAAKRSRAAAVLMSVGATAGLSAYFQHAESVGASQTTNSVSGAAVAVTTGSAVTPAAASTPGSTTEATAAATATTAPSAAATDATSTLADGTYAGATATNKWGPVQVQITVTGGTITEVTALQTPTDDRKSVAINQRATPTLASEVLSAQSAAIDTVSGATYTSDSYKVSLQSAIDLARSTALQAHPTS